jgi:hypothetical protein
MSEKKWIKLEELRESAMRRAAEAMHEIGEEEPGLLDDAVSEFRSELAMLGLWLATLVASLLAALAAILLSRREDDELRNI